MHPNPVFHDADAAMNLHFARDRGFGMLALNGAEGPLLAHVPFALHDGWADIHLVRSNPIARAVVDATPAVLAIMGPDSYVSPDWYGTDHQVPTWNYVAVHLRGTLSPVPASEMRAVLDRQAAAFEERLLPKHPWTNDKMPPETLDRMMRQILPFRFDVASVDGTWKLNQNKPAEARLRAAAHVASSPLGADVALLAAMMRPAR